jgi:hypothetical protein
MMTREECQQLFLNAFDQLSEQTKRRYPISVTDLITDLWPFLDRTLAQWEEKTAGGEAVSLSRTLLLLAAASEVPDDS